MRSFAFKKMEKNYKGKFIVIDGSDGSGKTTQINMLSEKLEYFGYKVEIADFPQYNTKSAGLIEEYLKGKYGSADEVNSYVASCFYACDRYDASFKIKEALMQGKIVIANRYVTSNMAHQGCKITNNLERKIFFKWLNDLEYKMFNIPNPDLILILNVNIKISNELINRRGRVKDIHEKNLNHLKNAQKIYLELKKIYNNISIINCVKNNNILNIEEIHGIIWQKVSKNLILL